MERKNVNETVDVKNMASKLSATEADNMEEKKEIMIVDEQLLRDKIYMIRNQQVMLDFDLAQIYGYETKNFNPYYQEVPNLLQAGDELICIM